MKRLVTFALLIGVLSIAFSGCLDNSGDDSSVIPADGSYESSSGVSDNSTDESDSSGTDSALNHSGIIPEGGTYYVGVTSMKYSLDNITAEQTFSAGDNFPETVNTGDVYVYGDYLYTYNQYGAKLAFGKSPRTDLSQNGWGVSVWYPYNESYGRILESVNGMPITSLQLTFEECLALKSAPDIPSGVTNLCDAFSACVSLESAPAIPENVVNMVRTFDDCRSLVNPPDMSKAIGVTNMNAAFIECTSLIAPPAIPESVTDMSWAFFYCKALVSAPSIPKGVENLDNAFGYCESLTGEIEINIINTVSCVDTFARTEKPIKLTGSCSDDFKAILAATAENGNVTY